MPHATYAQLRRGIPFSPHSLPYTAFIASLSISSFIGLPSWMDSVEADQLSSTM